MPALTKYLDKRTADDRLFDVDCTDLLDDDEVILSATVKYDGQTPNDGTPPLTFGDPMVNPAPMHYALIGRWAGIGKALQCRIGGGFLQSGQPERQYVLRFLLVTSINPALEATVVLRLTDRA